MELLRESDFRKQLKSGLKTGYLFFGEEDYLKMHAVKSLRQVICPDETLSFFNDLHLDALDFEPSKLLEALMPMPMMADRKLVTLTGMNFNTMRQGEIDALCDVLASLSDYDYNVFVLSVSADGLQPGILPKKPSATLEKLAAYLTPVHFEACSTAKLSAWLGRHFTHRGITVQSDFCDKMIEYCGHRMFTLANEVDKLCFYVASHGRTEPTEEELHLVCTSATEYDAFAFANAVMSGNRETALAILADYRLRRIEPLLIFGDVVRVICEMSSVQALSAKGAASAEIASVTKLHEFKVRLYQKSLRSITSERMNEMLRLAVRADADLKLSPKGYSVLERLICSL